MMKQATVGLTLLAMLAGSAGAQPDLGEPKWATPAPLPAPERRETNRSWSRSQWNFNVNLNGHGFSPADAVEAGRDVDGKTVYAAVGEFNGRLTPGKSKSPFTTAWVGFGGVEHEVSRFQLLSGKGYRWVSCTPMNPPANALTVGPDQDGTPLYIARGQYMGNWVAGKYRAGAQYCLVPFGGRERECFNFQLLVRDEVTPSGR